MQVLVTGGAGYIGSHVAKLLAENGHTPITFDNLSTGHKESVIWGPLVIGDLLNPELILKTLLKYKIEAVMHFAGHILVSESVSDPLKYFQNNVTGSLNLLEAMLKAKVFNIIFSSSCAVYAPTSNPIDESHEKKPITPYGHSKLMVENMIKAFETAYNFKSIILRYFNAAGASLTSEIGEKHLVESHLIPLTIESALKGGELSIFGNDYPTFDGSAIRDYIHVEDIANAHLRALEYLMQNQVSHELNLGSGRGFSVFEIIQKIEEQLNLKIKATVTKKRAGDPAILIANSTKALEVLGWAPKYPLDTIIHSAIQWHQRMLL